LIVRARLRISGVVQGVGFRHWIHRNARSLEICGWVMNLDDGSVEAMFQGTSPEINAMLDLAGNGPSGALVTECKVEWLEPDPGLRGFEVRFIHI